MKMTRNNNNNSENSSDMDEEAAVELRKSVKFGETARCSELPTISEIHFLRLSLNENLNKNRSREKIDRFSVPPPSTAPVFSQDQYFVRHQFRSQHSFIHTNMQNQAAKKTQSPVGIDSAKIIIGEKEAVGLVPFKRNSFLRNSWNALVRQSFKITHSRSLDEPSKFGKIQEEKATSDSERIPRFAFSSLRKKNQQHKRTSSSSSYFSNSSTNSVNLENSNNQQQLQSEEQQHHHQSESAESGAGISKAGNHCGEMAPLQGQRDLAPNGGSATGGSGGCSSSSSGGTGSAASISKSPSHTNANVKNDSSKSSSKNQNQQSTPYQMNSSNKDLTRSVSPYQKVVKSESTDKELKEKEKEQGKEKKRKELSSSRQKKFFRHFQQVSPDEHVINYFSCALVSDILLQGHLYITDNYFAFYSNVFGFVTKLLIPVVSVVKISKEKTAKIIPNAVGVATADERHVFGSFMSREAAYRLMLSVWRPIAADDIPETPVSIKTGPDVEISEYSIEDDSSCSVSGNESPTQVKPLVTINPNVEEGLLIRQRIHLQTVESSSGASNKPEEAESGGASSQTTNTVGVADVIDRPKEPNGKIDDSNLTLIKKFDFKRDLRPKKGVLDRIRNVQLQFPTDIHIVYLGVVLAVVLALFSGFLLYRIMDIQARTNNLDYKWRPNREIDLYEEVLKWQREIQERSVEETQNILNINLEQILKVRKSLESLSSLINGKRDSTKSPTLDGSIKT